MKPQPLKVEDFVRMNELALSVGLVPVPNKIGFYVMSGSNENAIVDLTASAEDVVSILKNAVSQLSERVSFVTKHDLNMLAVTTKLKGIEPNPTPL